MQETGLSVWARPYPAMKAGMVGCPQMPKALLTTSPTVSGVRPKLCSLFDIIKAWLTVVIVCTRVGKWMAETTGIPEPQCMVPLRLWCYAIAVT